MTKLSTLIAALSLVACHQLTPAAPTAPQAAQKVVVIPYDINVPDPITAEGLTAEFPSGVYISPVQAQKTYDFSWAYGGSPNVYAGTTNYNQPIKGVSFAGLVYAPYVAASHEEFNDCDWPTEYGQCDPTLTKEWLGRFTYAIYYQPAGK
jgi:hypothetical protein